jgi:predicted membrane protein
MHQLFCNLILFAICTQYIHQIVYEYKRIQWHVEECSVALLCN